MVKLFSESGVRGVIAEGEFENTFISSSSEEGGGFIGVGGAVFRFRRFVEGEGVDWKIGKERVSVEFFRYVVVK